MEQIAAAGLAAVRCDVGSGGNRDSGEVQHSSLDAGYIVVVKGPYGVSDENGSFTVSNVPPGSYTVTAWQETYGTADPESDGRRRKAGYG